jgi:hypothetical protein
MPKRPSKPSTPARKALSKRVAEKPTKATTAAQAKDPPSAAKSATKKSTSTTRKATTARKPPAKKASGRSAKKAAAEPKIQAVPDGSIPCARCGEPFKPRQRNQRFCSDEHRKAAGKARSQGKSEQLADVVQLTKGEVGEGKYVPGVGGQTPNYDRIREQLEKAGRVDTIAGGLALDVALRIDTSAGVTGIPPMLAALRDLVAEAMKDVEQTDGGDALDAIQASALRLLPGS